MKTSFYFFLWIIIYPILGLFNNEGIERNSFIIALIVVLGIGWLINRAIQNIIGYERATKTLPIVEDIYTGNVESFRQRISKELSINIVTAIYFLIATVFTVITIVNGTNDLVAIIIFALLTFGEISRCYQYFKANSQLSANPTVEQCIEIAQEVYHLDYDEYYESRQTYSYEEMLPPRPRCFKAYNIISMTISAICSIVGVMFIGLGLFTMISLPSLTSGIAGGMLLMYGTLAAYFGVSDFIGSLRTLSHDKNIK